MQHKTPRILVLVGALVCGTLIAVVTQILIGRHGLTLAAPWRDLFPTERDKLDSALAWWAIAAGGGMGGGLAFRILNDTPAFPTVGLRAHLKLLAGVAFFLILVFAGHEAPAGTVHGHAFTASALAATALGAFTAFCGIYLCAGAKLRD